MRARLAVAAAALLALAGLAAAAWWMVAPRDRLVPTAPVVRGRVETRVHTIGELRAARALPIAVPPMGGQLTIVALVDSGTPVAAGDVILEFDAAEQEFALEQATFDLQLADQEIVKAGADAAVQRADDEVALLEARFAVRRAELDAGANELVGALTAKTNLLLLEEARARLASLEREVASRRESSAAATDVLHEKRNKARAAVMTAERNINVLRVRAPFDGYVSIRQNTMALGGIMFQGAVLPDYRPGDTAFGGTIVAELVDVARIEVTAKLSEQDRATVEQGQSVDIRVDATPDLRLQGTVRAISSVASRQMFDAGTRRFDVAFDLSGDVARVRPGVSAALVIAGPVFEDALHVPRSAVFDVSGQPTVYVRTPSGFEPRGVKVRARTEAVTVIDGLEPPAEVALVDPTTGPVRTGSAPAPVTLRTSR
jgi:multidrug resistance efflux pump